MKQVIEELLSSKDDSQLTQDDKDNIKNIILTTLMDDSVDMYFSILSKYLDAKRRRNMSISDVATSSNLPEMTIKRFENLQSIPKVLTLLKILKAVGLGLVTESL